MNYLCLALVLKSKPRLKPRRYTDGTSRVLPFPIPLYSIYSSTNHVDIKTRSGQTAADMARGRYRALAQHVERFRPGLRGELAIS